MKSIDEAFKNVDETWDVDLTIEYHSGERARYSLCGKLQVNSLQTALKLAREVCAFPINQKLLRPFGSTGRRWIIHHEFREASLFLYFDKHEGRRWESS